MPGIFTLHQNLDPVLGELQFDCPACGKKQVKGGIAERVDEVRLLYVVPLLKLRATSVHCPECKEAVACDVPLERATQLEPAALAQTLRWSPSPAAKVVCLLGLLTCLVPFVGMVLSITGRYLARGTRGWPKTVAFWGTVIGIAVSLCVGLMLVLPMR